MIATIIAWRMAGVVADAEDEAVQDVSQRGQRLGNGGGDQADDDGVPDGGIGREHLRRGQREARGDDAKCRSRGQAELQDTTAGAAGGFRIARTEVGADVHLGGHGERVSDSASMYHRR